MFTYDANATAAPQLGTLTVAGLTVSIAQAGNADLVPSWVTPLVTTGLLAPAGLALDALGNIYIADAGNNAVEEWNASTQTLNVLVPAGVLANPRGIAVDTYGNVFIADTGNGAVEEWTAATGQLSTLVTGLNSPTGVAVDSVGNVYVVEQGTNAVREWNATDQSLTTLISSGLSNPSGIAVDLLGTIYIADTGNNAVEQWNPITQILNVLVSGLNNPQDVAVDGLGNVFIADAGSSTIKEWNQAAQQLLATAFTGLSGANGIALDSAGNLYAADTGNNAVEQFAVGYVGPGGLSEGRSAGIDTFHVLPSALVFSASSDQPWLALTGAANGIGSFSFSSNQTTASRSAHIAVLGEQLTVIQQGDTPATITKAGGDGQSVIGPQQFPAPLQVSVTGAGGNPLQGAAVTYQVTSGNTGAGASFVSGTTAVVSTDATGAGVAPLLTSNGTPGVFSVIASVGTLQASFTLTTSAASLSVSSLLTGSGAGNGSTFLNLTAPNAPWTAVSNAPWIHLAPASLTGAGSGFIQFSVDPNTNPAAVTGTITVAGQTLTITQAGAGSLPTEVVSTLVSSGLDLPFGLASDIQGNLYIADTGHNAIQKWSAATQQLTPLVATGLNSPHGVAVDSSGNVYFADANNNAVKEWLAATGQVVTLVASGLKFPVGVAVDSLGNVYIADLGNGAVKQWSLTTQQVTTLPGAPLSNPSGVAVDPAGNVYVADLLNNSIKQWSNGGQLTPVTATGLSLPNAVAVDSQGNLFLFDGNNSALKRWNPAAQQTSTLASTGIAGAFGVATDSQGNFYLVNPGTSSVQELTTAYVTIAGASRTEPAPAGSDSIAVQVLPANTAINASVDQPWLALGAVSNNSVTFSFTANTSVASRSGHVAVLGQPVAVTQSGDVPSTLSKTAGDAQSAFSGQTYAVAAQAVVRDASGAGVQGANVTFTLNPGPGGAAGTFLVNGVPSTNATVFSDVNGNVQAPPLTANLSAGAFTVSANVSGLSVSYGFTVLAGALGTTTISLGSAAGASSVLLSVAASWTATSNATWLHLNANSLSGTGNATVQFTYDANPGTSNRTGSLTVAGATLTATQVGSSYIYLSGITTLSGTGFKSPQGNALDATGNVYVADTANNAVKEWNATTHAVTTLVSAGLSGPAAVAVDGKGNVYITDSVNNVVKEWSPANQSVSTLIATGLSRPYGIAVDQSGAVYIADSGHNALKKWTAAGGLVTLVSSGLNAPRGIAIDLDGNIYIADAKNNAVKEWNPATGIVTTLVGSGLNAPSAVAVDGQGNVYIADTNNNFVKRWSPAGAAIVSLVTPGLKGPGGVALDSNGNVYIVDTGNSALKELSSEYLSLSATARSEPSAAGSDSVTALVYPVGAPITPTSDQGWLTITSVTNGVVKFNFTANNAATMRTGHIYILGQPVTITQSADAATTMIRAAGNGQNAAVKTAYPVALQTQLKDAANVGVIGIVVTYSVAPGANGASATFTGGSGTATATTVASGLATAPILTANGTAGTFTVKATAGALSAIYTLTSH